MALHHGGEPAGTNQSRILSTGIKVVAMPRSGHESELLFRSFFRLVIIYFCLIRTMAQATAKQKKKGVATSEKKARHQNCPAHLLRSRRPISCHKQSQGWRVFYIKIAKRIAQPQLESASASSASLASSVEWKNETVEAAL
jgi:hypothetical protein